MRASGWSAAVFGLAAVGMVGVASAQTAVDAAAEPVTPATLTRIDDGVFQIVEGSSTDLGDRRILLAFSPRADWDDQKRPYAMLNGRRMRITVGERIDLKAYEPTAAFVADKAECLLDVTQIVDVEGAPATATFRFFCP